MERNNILKKTKVISKNIIETMKLLLRYEKKYIFLSLFLNISVSTLPFISIIISQKMLNMLQIGGEKSTLIKVLILYTTIKMVSLILNNFNSYYLTKYSDYLFYHLNVLFLDKCSRLDYQDFENPQIYDALQRAEQQIGIRPLSLFKNILSLISGLVSFIVSLIILSNWHLWSLIGFIILPFAAYKYFIEINKKEYDMVY